MEQHTPHARLLSAHPLSIPGMNVSLVDARIEALRSHWRSAACQEPRWWIIKDAHSSNGFSAALFDRTARELDKTDVEGGYCYVIQVAQASIPMPQSGLLRKLER